jgi:dGTPase
MPVSREDRRSGRPPSGDVRTPFQIDRDRLLYSMPFRRLAGVTQVVSPGEGEIFHNRLTHSLKVAQIARRFAEHFRSQYPEIVAAWGELDPDVAEAAAMAHDLGHPPFGHIAEKELDNLISAELRRVPRKNPEADRSEGYEGNAQSFRIITELAVRRPQGGFGLDLTRATLNATLKYPWKWREHSAKPDKYGAYACDDAAFQFARDETPTPGGDASFVRSLEAQIMDWSDDIAYSVHDTEDFYRAGLIPLDRLANDALERDRLSQWLMERPGAPSTASGASFSTIFNGLFDSLPIREPYAGTRSQQEALYEFVSSNIHKFVMATTLGTPDERGESVRYPDDIRTEVFIFKQLIWAYVIESPALAAHQIGQQKAIQTLFHEFSQAAIQKRWALFPPFFRERGLTLYEERKTNGELPAEDRVRLVADTIASMTDRQALLIYQQFTGISPSSMLDPVVR